MEYRLRRKDGGIRSLLEKGTPIYGADGNILYIDGVIFDITERKHLEEERERMLVELKDAFAQIKTLTGLLPICSLCKKIRDDNGSWRTLEDYITENTNSEFSHGLCNECASKSYPRFYKKDDPSAG